SAWETRIRLTEPTYTTSPSVLGGRCPVFYDYLDRPLHPQHGDVRAAVGATGKAQVGAPSPDLQPVQLQLVEESRQDRLHNAQPPGARLWRQAEGGGDQERDGAGRPRLRVAGDEVAHGNTIVRAPKAGEHLRQPVVREVRRGL